MFYLTKYSRFCGVFRGFFARHFDRVEGPGDEVGILIVSLITGIPIQVERDSLR